MNNNLPNHIAIIMDGNGRWALRRGLSRLLGHKAGVEALKRVVDACLQLNIKVLSVYAFSTENWKRPKEEVDGIFKLVDEYGEEKINSVVEKGIKVTTMGDLRRLPEKLQNTLENIKQKSKDNSKLILNIGINYGGRAEILDAVNKLLALGKKSCTMEEFSQNLYTCELSDPDLIIRAGGEKRLSNFMLFQAAYSEFYFTKKYWPDFGKREIQKAIKVYQKRTRKFGGLTQTKENL
ncbi:MAG: di-trans,poly-cis-decaprenylcistransferase [Clostridia bacterium]|nr:di-trans,poly-cis-decaprenylcistransferase [Clostridia bacterium]